MNLVAFDLETNGCAGSSFCDARRQRIVQIAAQVVSTGERFSSLVNPQVWIPEASSAIHGITNEQAADAPDLSAVITELLQWLQRLGDVDLCLVAHNGEAFDKPLLCRECARVGVSLPAHWEWLDTMKIARRLWSESSTAEERKATKTPCTLSNLHQRLLGTELNGAHDAAADVGGLVKLLPLLLPARLPSDSSRTDAHPRLDGEQPLTDITGVGEATARALQKAFGLPASTVGALRAASEGRLLSEVEGTVRSAGYYGIHVDDWVLNILSAATDTPVVELTPVFPCVDSDFSGATLDAATRQRLSELGVVTLCGVLQLFLYDARSDIDRLRVLLGPSCSECLVVLRRHFVWLCPALLVLPRGGFRS